MSLPMAYLANVKPGNMTTMERLQQQGERHRHWHESYQEQMGQASSWQDEYWTDGTNPTGAAASSWQGSHSSFTTKSKINKDVSLGNLKNEWPKGICL